MKIGELSTASSTAIETIRYYEREGLLPPPGRTEGNFRIYEASHLERLQFIRYCRGLDMSLDEVRCSCGSRMHRRRTAATSMRCWTSTSAMSPSASGTAPPRAAAEGAPAALQRIPLGRPMRHPRGTGRGVAEARPVGTPITCGPCTGTEPGH